MDSGVEQMQRKAWACRTARSVPLILDTQVTSQRRHHCASRMTYIVGRSLLLGGGSVCQSLLDTRQKSWRAV